LGGPARQPRQIGDGLWAFVPDRSEKNAVLGRQQSKHDLGGLESRLRRVRRRQPFASRNSLHFFPEFPMGLDLEDGHGRLVISVAITTIGIARSVSTRSISSKKSSISFSALTN
jgi:hypothetical protein